MATRTIIFFIFFWGGGGGVICVKTMANFHKWTLKLEENIRCVGGGEIITDIKTLLTSTPKKVSQNYECSLPESDALSQITRTRSQGSQERGDEEFTKLESLISNGET